MNPFFQIFDRSQQFLLMQAYADEILSEAELMNFLMQETDDQQFVFITDQGVYLVKPEVSLDDFQNTFFAKSNVTAQLTKTQVELIVPKDKITLIFDSPTDAEATYADIRYILG